MASTVIYTRDGCGYCLRALRLLAERGAAVEERNASDNPTYRAEMMRRSGRQTFPQIFIGATHVGGCDDLHALDASGGIDALMAEAGR